ncbi:4'-phosphopantetheinyl transferase superfamily protein [Streptomyces sp. NPDC042638]|uniref:4'-phosphopantetheinyl transferase family protein n=1 Tax=Streptomyces sp. NPDC042638 TaxID=3154333 RepID=UPI003406A825
MADPGLRLWLVHTAPGTWQPDPMLLDAAERRRARAFDRPQDRLRYVAARTALRLLLCAGTGVAPRHVALIRQPCPVCGGPHGRPGLVDGPPPFSLAYSQDLCLIALARTPVGVDLERVPPPEAVASLTTLHPREQSELDRLPGHERALAFTRAWVRKEAWLKGIGTGLTRGLSTDYVGTGAGTAAQPAGWTITDVTVDPTRAAAIAVRDG